MAAADSVQGASIATNCQFHPKYAAIFRKVDAGMAIVAGAFYALSLILGRGRTFHPN